VKDQISYQSAGGRLTRVRWHTRAGAVGSISRDLRVDVGAAKTARDALRIFRPSLSPALYADLRLLTSEIVTAALGLSAQSTVHLQLDVEPRWVRGVVTYARKARTNTPGGQMDELCRGVFDRLADQWGIDGAQGTVWFALKRNQLYTASGKAYAAR
jgi:hypothetical protein